MWTRIELKEKARKILSKTYFVSLVAGFILLLAASSFVIRGITISVKVIYESVAQQINIHSYNNGENKLAFNDSFVQNHNTQIPYDKEKDTASINYIPKNNTSLLYKYNRNIDLPEILMVFLVLTIVAAMLMVISYLTVRALIGYSSIIGGYKFFLRAGEGIDEKFNFLKFGFVKGRYKNIVKTMFARDISVFLWTLLLVVPGIQKMYSYRMIPYILADNPYLSKERIFEISETMMDGEKLETFKLDLSFLGWILLSNVLLIFGSAILSPYLHATNTQLYLVLRDKVINAGDVYESELNLVKVNNEETIELFNN